MSIQVINAGASLKIVKNGDSKLVSKQAVKSIRVIGGNIKLHTDTGCAPFDYLPFAQITSPVAPTIEAMRDLIGDMLQVTPSTPGGAGMATEAKQNEAIGHLVTVSNKLDSKATEEKQTEQSDLLQTISNVLQSIQSAISVITTIISTQATLAKQNEQIGFLTNINAQIMMMLINQTTLMEEQLFMQQPLRMDFTAPEFIYEGFAMPGSLDADPVWAVRRRFQPSGGGPVVYSWAGGSKSRTQNWNNRAALIYI